MSPSFHSLSRVINPSLTLTILFSPLILTDGLFVHQSGTLRTILALAEPFIVNVNLASPSPTTVIFPLESTVKIDSSLD